MVAVLIKTLLRSFKSVITRDIVTYVRSGQVVLYRVNDVIVVTLPVVVVPLLV